MVSSPVKQSSLEGRQRNGITPNGATGQVNGDMRQRNGAQGNGAPSPTKARKAVSTQPERDAQGSKAVQDVPGLKDYQLGDCLGKGAFGSVYRGLNWSTGETVAVKQVKLADLPKTELRVIMLEIDLLKNLNHPNIVKYHGYAKDSEFLHIILEYCENGSLHSICKNFGKFPENLVALYMSQVLHGLLYLHEQGVIHRDIKGANILTTKEGLVKLADFGVATKATGLNESSVVGTPYWMAPEVIELSGATTASDIWSLGCTVIELLDGKPPYYKLQPMPALFRIVNDDHPPLPEGCSPAVRDFLMQCFQKDPNLRVSARKLLKHPWIVSAKRADALIPSKPTKYDEAVESVKQWNEALKSPTGSLRRTSGVRPMSASPIPMLTKKEALPQLTTPAPAKGVLNIPKTRPNPDVFASPEVEESDNWDDDFASSISPSALQLPHLRPHDNFAGLLSSEKLKAYASTPFDTVLEEPSGPEDQWDADLTVKSPLQYTHTDPLETVKPSMPARSRTEPAPPARPNSSSQRRGSQPKTQILHGAPKAAAPPTKNRLASLSRPSAQLFRENSIEDYSDLIAADDAAFQRKVQVLKAQEEDSSTPKLFHPSDLKNVPRSSRVTKKGGSLRGQPAHIEEPKEQTLQRSRSAVEIQKYAEDPEDEDFSDVFGKDAVALAKPDSDSGSERSTLRLMNSKLSGSWLGDDEDDDDPFAQLEEGFGDFDTEGQVAQQRYARQCGTVEGLVGSLKTIKEDDDALDEISEQLYHELLESPDMKNVIISSHGMLPILEILEKCKRSDIVSRLLRIVNMMVLDNVELQENLCFVGGIPIITKYAHKRFPMDIRLEAAAFVRQMYQTSTLTLQVFIACGGLNVLVEFLEEDLETMRDLVLIGVNGVWSVFDLQGPTPKNDFCRILSRSSVLYPLSLVLSKIIDEEGEVAEIVEGRIVNIFFLFSQAENHVKEIVADRMVLKRVLQDLKRMSPNHQITMLKFIKNLSMLATTHDALQNSNAIDVLTEHLEWSMKRAQSREISNQILNIMYNLCRLSKKRQEDAALSGLVPLLQKIVQTEWPLKEFALPILCDMAHSGNYARRKLWENKGLQFYISLLSDKYWQVTALDAIFIWLQEETAKVEQHLLAGSFSQAIADCFANPDASTDAFENLLEPLQKLLRLSPPVAASLASPELFTRLAQKLNSKKAVVKLNLLRIMRSICDAHEEQGALIRSYGLYDAIARMADHDQALLAREMASDLIKSADASMRRSIDGAKMRPSMRRSSSSTMTPPPPLFSSHNMPMPMPSSPHVRTSGVGASGFFDSAALLDTPRSARAPSYRPSSRDSSSGSTNGLGIAAWGSAAGASTKSRLPRTSAATRPSRLSMASSSSGGKEENVTPTHAPVGGLSAGVGGRQSAAISSRRKRPQSSGTDGSRWS
ncbi:Protein kinase of the Mitotic Exit Network [Coniosporium apollinis]|uniref:non-specific serine/threonine protein kinase n=1 Tax=Coniosporium apollinis TaxID=61459 RepID=A0ABQ9NRK9_9PEZI|nr:Protein kinase of the Mitotic Exit Network [Coniosporium apollinis]